MDDMREIIVGYDAREFWDDLSKLWPLERQTGFLFRRLEDRPMSVDQSVWRSVWVALGMETPKEQFGFQYYWSSLSDLEKATSQLFAKGPLLRFVTICATLCVGDYCKKDSEVDWSESLQPCVPDTIEPTWKFAGYDVADRWTTSAITNCGFIDTEEDVGLLRSRWGKKLTSNQLFASFEDAVAFKDFSDDRMRGDHAPFFIYGIWIVA